MSRDGMLTGSEVAAMAKLISESSGGVGALF